MARPTRPLAEIAGGPSLAIEVDRDREHLRRMAGLLGRDDHDRRTQPLDVELGSPESIDRNVQHRALDRRYKQKATTENILADAEKLADVETAKARLRADDPRMVPLSREARAIARDLVPKTAARLELSAEAAGWD
jgi:hypothetical protein